MGSSSTLDQSLKILSEFVQTRSVDEIRLITKNVLNKKRGKEITSFYMNLLRNLRRDALMTLMIDDICRVYFSFLFGHSDNVEQEQECISTLLQRFALLLEDDDKGTIRKRCHDVFERCADLVVSSSFKDYVRQIMNSVRESSNVSQLYIHWSVGRLIRTDRSKSVLATLELIRCYGSMSNTCALFPVLSGIFLRGYRQDREWFTNAERCRVRQMLYALSKDIFDASSTKSDDLTKRYAQVVIFQGFTDLCVLLRLYLGNGMQLPRDIRKPHIELCRLDSIEAKYTDMFPCSDPNQLSRVCHDEMRISHMNLYRSVTSCFRAIGSTFSSFSGADLVVRSREAMRKLSLNRRLMIGD